MKDMSHVSVVCLKEGYRRKQSLFLGRRLTDRLLKEGYFGFCPIRTHYDTDLTDFQWTLLKKQGESSGLGLANFKNTVYHYMNLV